MSHEYGQSKMIRCHLPLMPVKQTLVPSLMYRAIKWLLQIDRLSVSVVHNDRFPWILRLLTVIRTTSRILLWEKVLFVWKWLWCCKRHKSNYQLF
jgi:hypothetical protein